MARMIPSVLPVTTRSDAEKRMFGIICAGLSDQWTVVHSLGMTRHKSKPWAEIDFVMVGPDGLFCMEVKGGLVSRADRSWFTTPLHGQDAGIPQPLKESPFEQAGSASASLFKQIAARYPGANQHLMSCYCVATPDSEWTIQGIDFEPDLVYDMRDSFAPFSAYMDRVAAHWKNRWPSASPIQAADRASLVTILAGDFDLAPSLKTLADHADVELVRLTDEQAVMFRQLEDSPRVIARGGAGTGKTFLAVAEARRLASLGGHPLMLCYSKNLALHLQSVLADEPSITVKTMHSLMYEVVEQAGRIGELPDAEDEDIYGVLLPDLCADVLLDEQRPERYTALIVDEGQDLLSPSYLDVLSLLVEGGLDDGVWRWFFDPNQDLFAGIAGGGISVLMGKGAAIWKLTTNCRNTAPIADRVAMLAGIAKEPVLSADGPPTDIVWWDNREVERKLVSDTVARFVREGFRPEQITILSPWTLERSCMNGGLVGSRAGLIDLSRGGVAKKQPGSVAFSTISSFKGLESDVVILVDIDNLKTPQSLAQVYVGASRARLKLVVAMDKGLEDRFSQLAVEFGQRLAGQN